MKRIISVTIVLALAFFVLPALFACNGGDTGNGGQAAEEAVCSAALNQYDIVLETGEIFNLVPKKFNGEGVEIPVSEVKYSVEAAGVAEIDENGVITAKQAGGTYINVDVDGIEIACFVSVKNSANLNGLVIAFTGDIYKGLTLQAYAYIYEDGVRLGEAENVTFTGNDETKAIVTESGRVTGVEVCDDLTVSARGEYNGKTYSGEKRVSVVPPYYYVISDPVVRVAGAKTLSGKDNDEFTVKSGVTVSKVNVLDDSDKATVADITVLSTDERVAEIEIGAGGEISVRSKAAAGTTVARITVVGAGVTVIIKVETYTAISTIEDMDVLGYASLLDTELLSGRYALVNDIDYQGGVILPVASHRLTSTSAAQRVTGEQWRYYLNKTESGYAPVARQDIGKAGQGLTDAEFTAFAIKGINPANTSFSGVFDGNGFSIKNAAIFFGSVLLVEGNFAVPEYAGIFGRLSGTLKNVSFENITIQDPADMIANGYKFCAADKELRKTGGVYQYRGTSIVGSASGCEISNVYANINYNHKYIGNYSKAVLAVEMVNSCKVNNCVIESGGYSDFGYAVDSSLSSTNGALIKNCLAIGVNRFCKNITDASQCGVDGNYFLGAGKMWRDLAAKTDADGLNAADSVSATFGACWNVSEFNTADGGRPILIKGCSLS